MKSFEALIVHVRLPLETVEQLERCLRVAGWEKVRILNGFPAAVESGQFLIIDEEVGGVSTESLLAGLANRKVGRCVLVSSPYIEKVKRLKFGPEQLADMIVIKGPPEQPNHL